MFRSKALRLLVAVMLASFLVTGFARPAQAMDKRVKLAIKTGAYGAAGGFLIGTGTYAMGIGDWKNMLMGASAGLYAGLALAGYLILTQDDYVREKKAGHSPYSPRRPVGPDDWEEESDDGQEDHLPPDARLQSDTQRLLGQRTWRPVEIAVWTPVLSLKF